jgi:N-dimethylarginine dimethylaminohydrolase
VVYLEPKPPFEGAYEEVPPRHVARLLCYARWCLVVNGGAIVCRHGYADGRQTEAFFAKRFMELGCPILYTIHGKGVLEASNFVWLDSKHVAIAVGLRGNMEGVDQVRPILERAGVEEIVLVHMPGNLYTTDYRVSAIGGPSGCFHLDMTLGVADEKLAVVYPGLVDYLFIHYLLSNKYDLIEVPENEIHTCAPNILALEPGKVVIPAGNNETSRALRERGVDVIEVEISEFLPWGGPTCLTLPLIRKT